MDDKILQWSDKVIIQEAGHHPYMLLYKCTTL